MRKFRINTLIQISLAVCDILNIKMENLTSKKRKQKENVIPRTIYAAIARRYTEYPLSEIGGLINRDHSTIIHLIKNHYDFLDINWKPYVNMYTNVHLRIKNHPIFISKFNDFQLVEIMKGPLKGLPLKEVLKYANEKYSWEEMENIRIMLQEKLYENELDKTSTRNFRKEFVYT